MSDYLSGDTIHKSAITLIDDDELILSVTGKMLKKAGYQVTTFCDPLKAIEDLQVSAPDLIICDIKMPNLNGFELFDRTQDRIELQDIPFIFLSACDDTSSIVKGKKIGADDYITKPYDRNELLAVIEGKIKKSLARKNDLVEKKFENYKKEFAKIINHEIRTPLTIINTCSELLLDQQITGDEIEEIRDIFKSGLSRLNSMIQDISTVIDLSEQTKSPDDLEDLRVRIEPHEIVRQIVDDLQDQIRKKNITSRMEFSSPVSKIYGNYNQLFSAFRKIIENAVKFNKNGGLLKISIFEKEGTVTITVEDRGPGIREEYGDKIFSLFTQVDRDELEQQGLGLGLTIASRYIQINNGTIKIDSTPGEGTVFSISFDSFYKQITRKGADDV